MITVQAGEGDTIFGSITADGDKPVSYTGDDVEALKRLYTVASTSVQGKPITHPELVLQAAIRRFRGIIWVMIVRRS